MPRMKFLTEEERKQFDAPPQFNAAERKRFFHVTAGVSEILDSLKTRTNQVCFVLSLGYFRAAKRFFGREVRSQDVQFVARRLGYFPETIDIDDYEKWTSARHRKMILDYLGYREFDDAARSELTRQIRTLVRTQMRPKFILTRLVEILEANKTEIPSAWTLTELISQEMQRHAEDLASVLRRQLTPDQNELLEGLFDKEETADGGDTTYQRFRVTLLKRFSHSTKPKKIRGNVDDLRTLRELFAELRPVIESLDLTEEGIRYYANSVIKARVTQISRRAEDDRHVHMVCFVGHQYFRLQDILVDIMLACVQSIQNACRKEHKEKHYDNRKEQRSSLRSFVACVSQGAFGPLSRIESIAFADELTDTDKVRRIQDILTAAADSRQLADEQLSEFMHSTSSNEDGVYFDLLESNSVKLQNRVSEIVKELDFQHDDSTLMAAITYYQQKDGAVAESAPIEQIWSTSPNASPHSLN